MKNLKSLTLAYGEVTGHHHTIEGDIELLEQNNDYIVFKGTGILSHQEHDIMSFEDEIVVSTHQVEFDPFNDVIRRVLD